MPPILSIHAHQPVDAARFSDRSAGILLEARGTALAVESEQEGSALRALAETDARRSGSRS